MITIRWKDRKGELQYVHFNDNEKDKANTKYLFCLAEERNGLMCIKPDKSVVMPSNKPKFVRTLIFENSIKPSDFIKITTGLFAKDFLPDEEPTWKTDPETGKKHRHNPDKATAKQIMLLNNFGINRTEGLTKWQASEIISLMIKRDEDDLARPWMLGALVRMSPKNWTAFDCGIYANLTKDEALTKIFSKKGE